MSYQIAYDTMHLRPTSRLAHTEYCDHDALVQHVEQTGQSFHDAWQFDLLWNTDIRSSRSTGKMRRSGANK